MARTVCRECLAHEVGITSLLALYPAIVPSAPNDQFVLRFQMPWPPLLKNKQARKISLVEIRRVGEAPKYICSRASRFELLGRRPFASYGPALPTT